MKSFLAGLLILLAASTVAQAADQNQGHIIRLRKISIYDRQGWGQPIIAYTMLVPADWKVQGGIRWNGAYHCMSSEMITNRLQITSPDGRYGFEMFPDYSANWYQDPMIAQFQERDRAQGQPVCPLARPFNARDFITGIFLPGFRPGAQVVSVQRNPAPAKALYDQIMQYTGAMLRQNNAQISTDAAKVLLRYRGTEEMVMATTLVTSASMQSPTAMLQGRTANAMVYTSNSSKVVSYRAPAGELRSMERLYAAMLSSIHINPAWQNAVQQVKLRIQNIKYKGALDRQRIMSNAMNEIGEMHMKTWQHEQASQDRIAHLWTQSIREVEDYVDPATRTKVELPEGYKNVWSDGDETYILTDIAGFNPNRDIDTKRDWTQMKRAR
jgi:hypothetical protein